MRHPPIRLRITLWNFGFFAVAALLLCLTSWLVLRHSLRVVAKHEMGERIEDVQTYLLNEPPEASVAQLREALVREYGSEDQGKYLEIVDAKGNILYFSDRGSRRAPLTRGPERAVALLPFRSRAGGIQVLAAPISVRGETYQVATAISMERSSSLLRSFFHSLLVLAPLLLLGAAAGGYFISRRALAPVTAITAAARHISDKNLTSRLPVTEAQDEIAELSRTLNLMLERIDAAFSTVRAFTANASHELRTPVSLIRTRVEIALCFPRTSEHYRKVLEDLRSSTEHMTATLDSLLLLARADAGAERLRFDALELNHLVLGVFEEWRDAAERQRLTLTFQPHPKPLWIEGDATALRRLFHILMDNACRHTPPEGEVAVAAWVEGAHVTVEVSDTGTGIAPADLPFIFDRFFRAKAAPVNSRPGSGLGLSLASWIAEQHKATLSVAPRQPRGSCFRLLLSASAASGAAIEQASASRIKLHQEIEIQNIASQYRTSD